MALGGIHLTPQLVQAVRDAVDIVEIAGEATRLKRHGKRYQGLCPFHKEKTPSFSVDADAGLYYCFGCGAGGDAIKLYMQQSGDDFPAAIEALAQRYGIPLPAAPARGGRQTERRDLTQVLEAAAAFFTRELRGSDFARSYLAERRIPAELVERFGLGYAPDGWRHLLAALQGKIPVRDLVAAGLVGTSSKSGEPYDRFRHRLMFPIHAPNGRLVGFGGRTLGDDRAKYVNTSETEEFHKGRLLYGFHQAKREVRETSRALLVEGYFDVLGAVASGLGSAVAGMGTSLTAEQARLLGRYADEVVVAYDGDEAGEKAFQRALPVLLEARLFVRRALFPAGHDPDSLRLEKGPEEVVRLVENAADAVWLELERLVPPPDRRTPPELSRSAKEMTEILRLLRDEMVRRDYARRAAERLGVPEDVLVRRSGARLFAAAGERRPAVREVRSEEERALHFLLRSEAPAVLPHPPPPEEIFLDEDCRNIYAAFYALYKSGGRAPTSSEVLARLSSEGGAVDRMARLLLEESDSGEGDLEEALSRLVQRWHKRRQGELMRQIRQAQDEGDGERLGRLLEEKKVLSRSLHPQMHGRWW